MATIKEIAKIAKVSTATVSNVISDKGRVSESVRDRVKAVAAELDYSPNLVARHLRTKSARTIGVIVECATSFVSPPIISGVSMVAEKNGYSVILNNMDYDFRNYDPYNLKVSEYRDIVAKYSRQLLQKQADGIVFIGSAVRDVTGLIDIGDKPVVYAYGSLDSGKAREMEYCIGIKEEEAAYAITKLLVDAGNTRIGCITGVQESISTQQRLRGFHRCLFDHNIPLYPEWVRVGNWSRDLAYRAGREILSGEPHPTALFVMNDWMSYGVLCAAQELNIKVPGGLAVAGFDNLEYDTVSFPPLTSVNMPLYEMGQEAGRLLIDALHKHKPNEKFCRLDCSIVTRSSI